MKNLNFVFFMIFISLFLNSCGDIVDSELNTRTTILEYKYIKSDQEHSVIMPLKIGNVWYYDVKDLNDFGVVTQVSLDSIKVIDEVIYSNEKWFEVYYPILSKEHNLYMTNTDVGLWVKCSQCDDKSFLLAKYPDLKGEFVSQQWESTLIDDKGNLLKSESLTIEKTSKPETVTLPNGDIYETVKYNGYYINDITLEKESPYIDEYFTPDFGLVKADIYSVDTKLINKTFKLTKKPLDSDTDIDSNECRNNPRLTFGKMKLGEQRIINYLISNPYDEEIFFSDADILIMNDNPNNPIKVKPMGNYKLYPSEAMYIEFIVNLNQLGAFTSTIYLRCNIGCWYKIKIVGECISI